MTGHDELEARLRAVVGHLDPVPGMVTEGARAAFGWGTLDNSSFGCRPSELLANFEKTGDSPQRR
jgi:hypothetical protein